MNCEIDVNDDENQEMSMKIFENQVQDARNFPEDVNVHDVALKLNHGISQIGKCNTSSTHSNTSRTRISRKYISIS